MVENDIYDHVVAGAGITGLTSAYILSKQSLKTAIIDGASERGLIKSLIQDGNTLECGPNVVALKPDFLELIYELGLESNLVYPRINNYKQMVYVNNRPNIVPKSPFAFFNSELFSWTDKFKIIKNLFTNQSKNYTQTNISVSDFFTPIIGEKTVRAVLDPVLLGIYGGDVTKLRAESIFPQLYKNVCNGKSIMSILKNAKAKPKIAVLNGGMQTLSKELINRIQDKVTDYQVNISDILYENSIFKLILSDGRIIYSKSVIITTAGKSTASYIKNIDTGLQEKLYQSKAASLTVVHAAVKKLPAEFSESFGVLFPSFLKIPLLGVMFNSELFPHLSGVGESILTICFGGVHHPDFMNKDDGEVSELAENYMKEKLSIEDLRILNISRWKDAIPQYNLGHSDLISNYQELENKYPGLYFAGADTGGVGVPDRVKMAKYKCSQHLTPR